MRVFYCPGFEKQNGKISEVANIAGDSWHAIIGRAIYESKNIKKATKKFTKQLY